MQNIIVSESPRIASVLIEIPIASGASGRVTLPDVPQLRNQGDQLVVIQTVRAISPKVLSHGPTSGTATTPLADLKKLSFTIYSQGWEKGQYIPVLLLNDVADADSTAATTIPYRMAPTRFANWRDVDWNKSYLLFSNGQTASQASTLILEVEYLKFQRRKDGSFAQVNG